MKRYNEMEGALTILLDAAIGFFFAVILLITILQVILRYGFNEAVLGGNETMEGLFIYTTALGAAVAVRKRQHINIHFMVRLLPSRLQKIADVLVHTLIAFINTVMIYYSINWISKVGGNESPVMRIPEWTTQISIPIGCGLVVLYCLFNIIMTICGGRMVIEEG
ncbi:MAG: TRAP transporter small permease [Deltaproteobacteria bacterium]|nr:TRAP transporter small permease [Deltaproteobacteria bacterium]